MVKSKKTIKYYDNGNIKEIVYLNEKNQIHRLDGPALIEYYENGEIVREYYYMNNILHRENKPAFIKYYNNRNIMYEEYYINGEYHRDNGPSIIDYYDNGNIKREHYYNNGKYNNNNPIMIYYYENGLINSEYYLLDDNSSDEFNNIKKINYYNSDDKKIKVIQYLSMEYLTNSYLLNNDNGPASISFYFNGNIKDEYYYINDEIHRLDGPAIIEYNEDKSIKNKEYYIEGKHVYINKYMNFSKEQFIYKIKQCSTIKYLLVLKLIINGLEFSKIDIDELNELIESKIILLQLQ